MHIFYGPFDPISTYRDYLNSEATLGVCRRSWAVRVARWCRQDCDVQFHSHFYSLAVFLFFFLLIRLLPLLFIFHFCIYAKSVPSLSSLIVCPPACLSVCLPLAVVLAPIADALIGIRRSARDLIQKGVSAGCLETDLASKALHGIKPSISVLSATCGQTAKELWKLLSEAKRLFAFVFINHAEPHVQSVHLTFGTYGSLINANHSTPTSQCKCREISLSCFSLHWERPSFIWLSPFFLSLYL